MYDVTVHNVDAIMIKGEIDGFVQVITSVIKCGT